LSYLLRCFAFLKCFFSILCRGGLRHHSDDTPVLSGRAAACLSPCSSGLWPAKGCRQGFQRGTSFFCNLFREKPKIRLMTKKNW
jgi:hypothetical protein